MNLAQQPTARIDLRSVDVTTGDGKVERIRPALGLLTAAFMNGRECERLMAVAGAAESSGIAEAANTTLFVTRGERGAVVYLGDGSRVRIQPPAAGRDGRN
jgi:sugar/nucleoside kinase (ribokinase family)